METGRQSGQESGGVGLMEGDGDWLDQLLCERTFGAETWQGGAPAEGGPGRTARERAPAKRPANVQLKRQFAEAFYLMVMASDLRERARALGRRYGLNEMEVREEILRYIERLASEMPTQSGAA
jgi:hypothetical protein